VEGSTPEKSLPEKSQSSDAHPHQQQHQKEQQHSRGAMAGQQRYLRYIVFALVVSLRHVFQHNTS
jgi:hypothetical protein